jgi:sugar phosphate permease
MGGATEQTPLVNGARPQRLRCLATRDAAVITTLALISFGLFVRVGCNTTVSVSLPELQALGFESSVGLLPGIGTAFYACGKLSQVFMVHIHGGRTVLLWTFSVSCVGMFLFASGTMALMAVGWAASQFAIAHVWGAACHLMACWVDASMLGRATGLAFVPANDMGGILFPVFFSSLQRALPSPSEAAAFAPFWLMGGLSLCTVCTFYPLLIPSVVDAGFAPPEPPVPLTEVRAASREQAATAGVSRGKAADGLQPLVAVGGQPKVAAAAAAAAAVEAGGGGGGGGMGAVFSAPKSEGGSPLAGEVEGAALHAHPFDGLDLELAIRHAYSHTSFWACNVENVAFELVRSISNYIPIFASAVCGYTFDEATLLLSANACGCLIGSMVSGVAVDCLSPGAKRALFRSMQLIGIGSAWALAGLVLNDSVSSLVSALPALLALMSFASTAHWGVLMNTYMIDFGGPAHAGTVCGLVDALSFGLMVPTQFGLGQLVQEDQWKAMFTLSSAVYTLGHVAAEVLYVARERGR